MLPPVGEPSLLAPPGNASMHRHVLRTPSPVSIPVGSPRGCPAAPLEVLHVWNTWCPRGYLSINLSSTPNLSPQEGKTQALGSVLSVWGPAQYLEAVYLPRSE